MPSHDEKSSLSFRGTIGTSIFSFDWLQLYLSWFWFNLLLKVRTNSEICWVKSFKRPSNYYMKEFNLSSTFARFPIFRSYYTKDGETVRLRMSIMHEARMSEINSKSYAIRFPVIWSESSTRSSLNQSHTIEVGECWPVDNQHTHISAWRDEDSKF